MDLAHALERIGVPRSESEIYLGLLRLGPSPASALARSIGTNRSYTYELLRKLQEKGLVSQVVKSAKQHFEAAAPERLLELAEEARADIEEALPALRKAQMTPAGKSTVEVFEGKEGIKAILQDVVRTKSELVGYGEVSGQLQLLTEHFERFAKKRARAGIKVRLVTHKSLESEKLRRSGKNELRQVRFLPTAMTIPSSVRVYADKVAIFSFDEEPSCMIIHDSRFAQAQRTIFEMLWEQSSA